MFTTNPLESIWIWVYCAAARRAAVPCPGPSPLCPRPPPPRVPPMQSFIPILIYISHLKINPSSYAFSKPCSLSTELRWAPDLSTESCSLYSGRPFSWAPPHSPCNPHPFTLMNCTNIYYSILDNQQQSIYICIVFKLGIAVVTPYFVSPRENKYLYLYLYLYL